MKEKLIKVMLILFILSQLWSLFIAIRDPYIGVNLREDGDGRWYVQGFDSAQAEEQSSLKIGDRIVSIDGGPVSDNAGARKWHSISKAQSLVVEQDGKQMNVEIQKHGSRNDLLSILAMMVCFLSALTIIRFNHSKAARVLTAMMLVSGGEFGFIMAAQRIDSIGKLGVISFIVLVPATFFHFMVSLFEERASSRFSRWILWLHYAPFVVIFTGMSYTLTSKTAYGFFSLFTKLGIIIFLLQLLFMIIFLSSMFLFKRKRLNEVTGLIKYILLSMVISFGPFSLLTFLPKLVMGQQIISGFITSWFILLFPLTFAYMLATRQLFDISNVYRRVWFAAFIALLPSLLISIALARPWNRGGVILVENFLFVQFIMTTLLYSLEYWGGKLERIVFPRKYMLQNSLHVIAKKLQTVTNFREFHEHILSDIVNTLNVRGGAIVFRYANDVFQFILEGDVSEAEIRLQLDKTSDTSDYTILEIIRNNEYDSFLFMTQKMNYTRLTQEEVRWLNMIVSYLGTSLENMFLIRQLTWKLEALTSLPSHYNQSHDFAWIRKVMFEVQEKERTRIAQDVHDSTMQDLYLFKRKLMSLSSIEPANAQLQGGIDHLAEHVEIINEGLRQTCFELNPYLLSEVGLIQTMRKVIMQGQGVFEFEVHLEVDGFDAIEKTNMETKRHLFRIFQEMLNNACKHSRATELLIHIRSTGDRIHLQYKDDGVGFDHKGLDPMNNTGMGLGQIQSRVLLLNGKWNIHSAVNQGTSIEIQIPTFQNDKMNAV